MFATQVGDIPRYGQGLLYWVPPGFWTQLCQLWRREFYFKSIRDQDLGLFGKPTIGHVERFRSINLMVKSTITDYYNAFNRIPLGVCRSSKPPFNKVCLFCDFVRFALISTLRLRFLHQCNMCCAASTNYGVSSGSEDQTKIKFGEKTHPHPHTSTPHPSPSTHTSKHTS